MKKTIVTAVLAAMAFFVSASAYAALFVSAEAYANATEANYKGMWIQDGASL
jgi:hypothetical protein